MNKNILFLFNSKRIGGAETAIFRLINNLSENISCLLITDNPNAIKKYLTKSCSYKLIPSFLNLERDSNNQLPIIKIILSAIRSNNFCAKLIFSIFRYNINFIHIHMLQSVFLLFPLLISNKLFFQPIKVIYHIHELRNYNKYERFVHKVGIFCASKIIVVSKAVFEKSKQFTNNTKKINLIYNGFNFDLIVSQMNGPTLKNDITGKEFKIGLIGNLVEGKGHLSTLKQFSHEFCLSEKIHFTFLGKYINKDSNYESLLKNKLLEFDNRTLHLTGWVENIYPYYNKFDLILIPTTCELGEAQSNVIIEALSCNSLVLCSNVGGNKEIINEGENGLFFECNNFFEMKDKIMHIKSNYSKFKKIKNNGLDSVKSKFDISRSTTLYEKFIFDTTLF